MTITFQGTSNGNLTIHQQLFTDPSKYDPIQDIDDMIRNRWIPHAAQDQGMDGINTDLKCVQGSDTKIPGSTSRNTLTTKTLPTYSGLIGTILNAYNLHQNLVLRPDDIWITILGQFSAYVNGRAEELRGSFVEHSGQMELTVQDFGTACAAPYERMTRAFLDEIAANLIDPTLKEWFLPGFSTTTSVDEVVASAAAMCTFQAYFTYKFSLLCGIPEITLEGSVDDWKALRQKIERLTEFDDAANVLSNEWVPYLRRVLDEFVVSAESGSKNNMQFWNSVVQLYEEDFICAKEDQLSGWLSVFTFFDGKGSKAVSTAETNEWPHISFDSINSNVVTCPAKIDDNGVEYNATLYVGQMAFDLVQDPTLTFADFPAPVRFPQNVDATLHTLQPRNDWALAIWENDIAKDWQDSNLYKPEAVDRELHTDCQLVLLDNDAAPCVDNGDSSDDGAAPVNSSGALLPRSLSVWVVVVLWYFLAQRRR